MKKSTKVLAVLMAMVMAFSMFSLSVTVFAEDETPVVEEKEPIKVSSWFELQVAMFIMLFDKGFGCIEGCIGNLFCDEEIDEPDEPDEPEVPCCDCECADCLLECVCEEDECICDICVNCSCCAGLED